VVCINKTQVCLVTRCFLSHLLRGQSAQLVIDQGEQPVVACRSPCSTAERMRHFIHQQHSEQQQSGGMRLHCRRGTARCQSASPPAPGAPLPLGRRSRILDENDENPKA
jgi:hypothetical protein